MTGKDDMAVAIDQAGGDQPPAEIMGLAAFLEHGAHWRVMLDLGLLSLFAGLYSVPMYALIQMRSQPTHRARIIAANNILNALFMIASSLIAGALLGAGFTVPQIFLFTGIANAVVAFYIFMLVPEYLLRFVAWIASRFIYRFDVKGDLNIPTEGAAVIVCNHVSFVDAVLLMAASPRPIRFLMDHRIFKVPVLGWLFSDRQRNKDRTELIVLITPKVVSDGSSARQITDEYRQQLQLMQRLYRQNNLPGSGIT